MLWTTYGKADLSIANLSFSKSGFPLSRFLRAYAFEIYARK